LGRNELLSKVKGQGPGKRKQAEITECRVLTVRYCISRTQ